MNAREAYDYCEILSGLRKHAESVLAEFVGDHSEHAIRLLLKIQGSFPLEDLVLKDDNSVVAACTIIQLSKCFEKLAKEKAGSAMARDN